MKYLSTVFFLLFLQIVNAEEIKYIESDKLKIVGRHIKTSPDLWLQSYGMLNLKFKRDVRIAALFDIENVKEISIYDENAVNKRCKVPYRQHLTTLFFDPENNIKEIALFIYFPCVVHTKTGFEASFKLNAITADNKHYTNTVIIPVNLGAFRQNWSSDPTEINR